MKTKIFFLLILAVLIGSHSSNVIAQGNTWKLSLNNNVGIADGIGSSNNADFKIFSNNNLRINVRKNGTTDFYGKVNMNVDSLKVKGLINVDSMRIKGSLHIGDSSLVIDPDVLILGNLTDRVSSNRLSVNLMRRVPFWGNTYFTSNIRYGIGTQTPQHMLHLNWTPSFLNPINQSVNLAVTNGSTGVNATDGFQLGIQLDGTAELKQQENLSMLFYTNNLQRMEITKNGEIGINNNGINYTRFNVNAGSRVKGGLFFSNYTEPSSITEVLQAQFIQTAGTSLNQEVHGICSEIKTGASIYNIIALRGEIIGCSDAPNKNYAVFGKVDYFAVENYGGKFEAMRSETNYGINSYAHFGTKNFGGYFESSDGSDNFGIYSSCPIVSGQNNFAGYFNGSVFATNYSSDIKLKDSLNQYKNALISIRQINPKTFYFKTSDYPSINLPIGRQFGFIAQEIEPLYPELVSNIIHPAKYDTLGNMIYDTVHFKSLNYPGFVPILTQAIKELDSITTGMPVGATNGCLINTNKQVEFGTNPLNYS